MTIAIFAAMIVAVVVRPRGWSEAWWTCGAALLLLAIGAVTPREATGAVLDGKNALLFLLSLLLLAFFVEKAGFFAWAAARCARLAGGDARALFRNAFVLGALVSATMSLDTTAVMLAPVVLSVATRAKLPTAPFVVLCAFVANVGSLLLPISNLTNLLVADALHLSFGRFTLAMAIPQLVALATTYALLRWHFRKDLAKRFELPDVPPLDRWAVGVLLAVLVGYFVAAAVGIEPYVVAFAGALVLAIVGKTPLRACRELAWGVFPLAIGLFVAVRAVENLGIPKPAFTPWLAAGATTVASNLANNLPVALLAKGMITEPRTAYAALVGTDIGALILPFGSLATLLVLNLARKHDAAVPAKTLIAISLWVTPIVVAATVLSLYLT